MERKLVKNHTHWGSHTHYRAIGGGGAPSFRPTQLGYGCEVVPDDGLVSGEGGGGERRLLVKYQRTRQQGRGGRQLVRRDLIRI